MENTDVYACLCLVGMEYTMAELDDKLPSLRQLARKYETSSNTIAFAFRILRDEGYIFSIPAVGYFIKKRNDFQISKQVKTILKSYYDTENKNDNLINFTSTDSQ